MDRSSYLNPNYNPTRHERPRTRNTRAERQVALREFILLAGMFTALTAAMFIGGRNQTDHCKTDPALPVCVQVHPTTPTR